MLPDVSEIRMRRKALGMTQDELALRSKISRTSMVKLENEQADLAYKKVKAIFDVLEAEEGRRKTGLLDSVTLGMIHSVPFVSLDVDMLMNDVFIEIHRSDFSQFVVTDSGRIVGSITDRGAFGALSVYGDVVKDHVLGDYMEECFPVLSVSTPVVAALPLLHACQAVLTRDRDRVVGIVTNNDVGKIFMK